MREIEVRWKEPIRLQRELERRRPRGFEEWTALRRWGRLPSREADVVGFLLREARERQGLSQTELADRLGCTQQAISQAERWHSNPTIDFMRRWAEALHLRLEVALLRS